MSIDFTRPITTRDGRAVRILCTDRKGTEHPIVGLVAQKDIEELYHWTSSGFYNRFGTFTTLDLINPPVKKYINLFPKDCSRTYFDTREQAEASGKASKNAGYIKTIEVEL